MIFLTVFIDLLGFGMVLPLLPIYAKQFTVDDAGWIIGLLMSSFSAMQFLCAPMWGRLSDRIGRRPVLMIGLAGSVVFYTVFGVATIFESLPWLFASRIGAGIAGATISTAQAYIADTTSKEQRTKGMALIGAAFGLGFTFGPLFGAIALLGAGGHAGPGPGFAAAALSTIALLLAIFVLPESLTKRSDQQPQRRFDLSSLREAVAVPSVGLLLLATFVCVFGFANFESTLALLVNSETGVFGFNFREVCFTFAYVGLVLSVAQGWLVRRLSGKISDGALCSSGAVIELVGFTMLAIASNQESLSLLMAALAVVVCGFAFMTPSLQSLISRRSDPAKQGGILGLGQSFSALARIVGPVCGSRLFHVKPTLPSWVAASLMVLAFVIVVIAARSGRDYGSDAA